MKKILLTILIIILIPILIWKTCLRDSLIKNSLSDLQIRKFRELRNIVIDRGPYKYLFYKDSIKKFKHDISYFLANDEIKGEKSYINSREHINFGLPTLFSWLHKEAISSGFITILNDNKVFFITKSGILFRLNIVDNYISKQIVKTNLLEFLNYENVFKKSEFGIKDLIIIKDKVIVSFIEKKDNSYSTTVLISNLSENLEFKLLFSPDQKIKNDFSEFSPVQSGGQLKKFDDENILLTIGDYRKRILSQDDNSVFGKLLLININNGNYKIIAKGLRNSLGLDYNDTSKSIIMTDMGPAWGDEINLMKINENVVNFGWPISSYGYHYGYENAKNYSHDADYSRIIKSAPLKKSHIKYGFKEPLIFFNENPGVSNIRFIKGTRYFVLSTMGWDKTHQDRIYTRSFLIYTYNSDLNDAKLVEHIDVNERIRDFEIYKNKIYYMGETSGTIGIIDIKDYFEKSL